jgi:hypothetical protein
VKSLGLEGSQESAREIVFVRGLAARFSYRQGEAEHLPFPDDSFDAATVGFGMLLYMDVNKRLDWARAVFMRDLAIQGLPFDIELAVDSAIEAEIRRSSPDSSCARVGSSWYPQ